MKINRTHLPLILCFAVPSFAQAQVASIPDIFSQTDASTSGKIIQYVVLLTILSLAPSILIMVTSFTRFIIAFSFLRSAIGMQSTPASIIITSLSLFLTFFVMAPTFNKSWNDGLQPLLQNRLTQDEAFKKIIDPFQTFMLGQVREKDLSLFKQLAAEKLDESQTQNDTEIRVLIPAFMVSELRRGFEIGFLISLPFLIIDLIVATITMSMGMMMMPPSVIALPFKVLFFVLIDGWSMLAGSLVRSFS
jgi:flagellar biosynthesis protein FliP